MDIVKQKHYRKMKRTLLLSKILLLIAAGLVSINVNAYNRSVYRNHHTTINHFLTVGASAGYSNLIENYNDLSTVGTIGGLAGIGYEMRINEHFYWSLGAELQWVKANATYELAKQSMPIIDTQGKPAIMYYQFDPITEYQRIMYVQVPVMVGFYERGFYLGGGIKVGLPVLSGVHQLSSYSTSVTYNEYVGEFGGMPEHGYGKYTLDQEEKLAAQIKVSVAAEIGYDVLSSYRRSNAGVRHGLRIAAVCEYGLNNVVGAQKTSEMFEVSPEDATIVSVKPFYQTHSMTGHSINNLYAGIKITWICDFSRTPCDCDE